MIASQSRWSTHFRRIGKPRPVSCEGVCGRAIEEDKDQQDDQYHRHCCGDSGGQLEACSLAPSKMRLHYHSFNGVGSGVTKQSRVHPVLPEFGRSLALEPVCCLARNRRPSRPRSVRVRFGNHRQHNGIAVTTPARPAPSPHSRPRLPAKPFR